MKPYKNAPTPALSRAQQAALYRAAFLSNAAHPTIVLFTGPGGTGKAMAAEMIASSMQVELRRIDLGAVVGKFIGETEKNLNAMFEDAERAGAVILIDEADALLGKRSEIKDAHDRYANLEVDYLLQRIERSAGVVILATNHGTDEEWKKRLRLQVSIDFPE
jgi:SpoVK/Ycf46/Vps4 family AAA+-type ATPase